MNKSSLPKIIILSAILVGLFYLLYNYVPAFEDFVDITEERIVDYVNTLKPQETSVFDETSIAQPYVAEVNEAVSVFYAFLDETRMPPEGQELSPYWTNWNWQTDFFQGDIVSADFENKTVTIAVDLPRALGTLENVTLQCEDSKTASFYHQNLILQDVNFNMFETFELEDTLYAKCLNESCTGVGDYCILVQRNIRNE